MGRGQPPSPHHTACLRARAERGRTYDLLRLPTWPSIAGPQGRCICYPAGKAPDQQGGVEIPIL